jgi:excisionase family DNA binding protein
MKAQGVGGMAPGAEEPRSRVNGLEGRRSRLTGRAIGPVRSVVALNGHGHSAGTGAAQVQAVAAVSSPTQDRESSEHRPAPRRWTPPAPLAARLLTLRQTADYLGLSTWTVRELQWKGRLPRVALSRKLLFDRADVDRLIDASKERP